MKSVVKEGYGNYFMTQANKYLELSKKTYYKFCGFEDLELSTQILLKESIKRGIKFNFLDRQDNFIELSNNGNRQIVKRQLRLH